jgi:hypothetical protein
LLDSAPDEMARRALIIIRDSWIAIANDSEIAGATDPEAALLILDDSMALTGLRRAHVESERARHNETPLV